MRIRIPQAALMGKGPEWLQRAEAVLRQSGYPYSYYWDRATTDLVLDINMPKDAKPPHDRRSLSPSAPSGNGLIISSPKCA